jgi:predicted nuclease of predicted toxin-antitoxin system
VFFLDRSLECAAVVQALRDAGAELQVHSEHFADDERDDVWLPEVARQGWAILTKDKKIRRRPIEKEALIRSGARAFVLSSGNMRGQEMGDVLVRHLRRMERIVHRTDPPFVAVVHRSSVKVLSASPGRR